MKKMISIIMLGTCMLGCNLSNSQDVFGKWKTIDDRNGVEKAVIEIYERDGLLHGKVVQILEEGKKNAKCVKCEGERKDKPILGMKIIEDASEHSEGIWKGKTLFDPEQAMTFRCKIWLNPENSNELMVRGYLAFIYRTQKWIRIKD
tara:strand:- start:9344 stop:9784 length:441 start_codon:yes stop_codon:yes gene_type:complete